MAKAVSGIDIRETAIHTDTTPFAQAFTRRRLLTGSAQLAGAAVAASWSGLAQAAPAREPLGDFSRGERPHLVEATWLRERLGRDDLLVLDASPGAAYARGHLPGAVHADRFAFGAVEPELVALRRYLARWGVRRSRHVVLYDNDGQMWAARLLFDLLEAGFPAERLALLDGGLSAWTAAGGERSTAPVPAPGDGDFEPQPPRAGTPAGHADLPQVLAATADPGRQVLVDALEAEYFHGSARFFDRGGHLPHARSMPRRDFLGADGRFKPVAEIRRMAAHRGLAQGTELITYCGGGVAAAIPWFALHLLAGMPSVRLYPGSQLEWLRDDRGLPLWTYAQPNRLRGATWLAAWGSPMLRAVGTARLGVVDVRPAEAYAAGHLPFAISLPASSLRSASGGPLAASALAALATRLAEAGLNPAHEAVIVGAGGLDADAALAAAALQAAGQAQVSLLRESVDDWALAGHALTKTPTRVGTGGAPGSFVLPPVAAAARPSDPWVSAANPAPADAVWLDTGPARAVASAGATRRSLPWRALVDQHGLPLAAGELLQHFEKAGVPRWQPLVCTAADPADAAAGAWLLQLMGYDGVRLAVA